MVLDTELLNKSLSKMTQEEIENYENAVKIFDYFDDLPLITEFDAEKFSVLYHQATRNLIIKSIGKGVEDTYPPTGETKIRRALSGMEILEKANEILQEHPTGKFAELDKIKKANLFFHLNKLEESGFIQEVGVIKSGRRRTTYYGKTSKIYITFDLPKGLNYEILENDNFVRFIKNMNPDLSENKIIETIAKLNTLNDHTSRYFMDWLQGNEEHLKNLQFNFVELLKIVGLMHRFNHETVDGLRELSELMNIDIEKLKKTD